MRCVLLVGFPLLLLGCSNPFNPHADVPMSGMQSAERALISAEGDVDRAAAQYASRYDPPSAATKVADIKAGNKDAARPLVGPAPQPEQVLYVPPELQRPFDANLTGVEIGQAAEFLGARIGYRVKTDKPLKAQPIIVSLVGKRVTVVDLLRSLGAQGGRRADVNVDASQKLITVVYKDTGNA